MAYEFDISIGAEWRLPQEVRVGPFVGPTCVPSESRGYSVFAKAGIVEVNPSRWKELPHRRFLNLPVVTSSDKGEEIVDPKAMLSFTKQYGMLDYLMAYEGDTNWTKFLEHDGYAEYLKDKDDCLMLLEYAPTVETISKEISGYSPERIQQLARTQSFLKYAWRTGDEKALDALEEYLSGGLPIHFEIDEGRFRISVVNVQRLILMLFFRDHAAGKTAICANPDCPAPYFLRSRKTQKICESGECVAWAQRNYALKWWRENESKASKEKLKKGAK